MNIMINKNVVQLHCLKEEKAEPSDEVITEDMKWECLGAACPSSCCHLMYARIFIHEIVPLSKHFPITFCMTDCGGEKHDIAICILLRHIRDGNYCTYLEKGSGCAMADNRPLACKQFPFSAVKDETGNNRLLVRLSCPGFSEVSGHPILMPGRDISPYLKQECIDPATSGCDSYEETRIFVETLNRYNLIADGAYTHKGETILFKLVDLKKLYELPKETLNDFRARGYMQLINAHANSLIDNITRHIDTYLARMSK
ncbi:MAG: SapC family protein [Nitrospirae bacterium]|nr:SapC family protein [Nitrospirota bacterium]